VWPLPWQPSLAALSDPPLRRQALAALTATGTAGAVVVCGLIWRRARWFAFTLAAGVLALAIPRLGVLFVEAYPTTFFSSPTEFAATAIVRGARLFAANCIECHGAEGRGDGAQAKALPVQPADLTATHFQTHTDGDLYWFIGHGFATSDGTTTMPGFAGKLSSEGIWDVIDFLRAQYAGASMRRAAIWPDPVAMPQFDALCANGRSIDLDDLRSRPIRIIAIPVSSPDAGVPPSVDVATILVARNSTPEPGGHECVATEPQLWTALAIILGISPDDLAGSQMLVDQNGWLRAAWRPGASNGWDDANVLAARLRDILAHPLIVSTSGHHH
jgi:mono/diheme cytochrome c family protein